ncbi:hypothetical protein [Phyllobacterium sp. SB3]|uniref:hypothetical protein n=1 Tax=Phyllobacterium sp. SB3 TaxID=3156073 RepID=UPI0032AF9003
MAKLATVIDLCGTVANGHKVRKHKTSRPSCIAQLSFAPTLGQVTGKSLGSAIFRVHVTIHRLMAEPVWTVRLSLQPAGDLFGRQAGFQTIDDDMAHRHDRNPVSSALLDVWQANEVAAIANFFEVVSGLERLSR